MPNGSKRPHDLGFAPQAMAPFETHPVTVGAASAQSAAHDADTYVVRLCATVRTWVAFGANPTADKAAGMLLPADSPEYFVVTPGEKVAALQDSAGGTLTVTEMR